MSDLTLTTFQPLVGESFQVAAADGAAMPMRLKFAEALEGPQTHNMSGQPIQEGFSLIFETDAESAVGQGLYTFVHPDLGEGIALFMTPIVCANPEVRHYQVVVNRLIVN